MIEISHHTRNVLYLDGLLNSPKQGSSTYPSVDAWGNPLGSGLEGTKIAGEYSFVLDGVQADQDYLKILFDLQRVFSRQQCCHFCKAIQWVRADMPPTGDNDPELLYTRWGRTAAHRSTCLCWDSVAGYM